MKNILCSLLLSFCAITFAADSVKFTILEEGKYIERSIENNVYSAVIYTQQGFEEFLKEFPISVHLDSNIFDSKVVIAGFSDTLNSVHADRLEQTTRKTYLTIDDGGIEYKRRMPQPGMKYSAFCVISVDKPFNSSHVQIRESISGLCKQYGRFDAFPAR